MKRGSLFLIGLLSAIITVVSLGYAFGNSRFYNNRYYDCYDHYNDRNYKNGQHYQKHPAPDSSVINY